MASAEPDQLTEFLHDEVGNELRSVIYYNAEKFDIIYARDDVRNQYSDEDLEKVRQELGMESFGKPVLEESFVHGELNATIRCFDEAIEMHFLASDTEGIAVGLEPAAFVTHRTFIGRCLEEAGFGYA